jgi:thiol-disulfide isomerase/thioredoxin
MRIGVSLSLLSLALPACGRTDAPKPEEPPQTAVAAAIESPPPSLARPSSGSGGGSEWGQGKIAWQPYQAGLAKAKAENKPVCLVLSTTWCPHCRNYAQVFEDAKVREQSARFVMIHVDADKEPDVARQYQPDGGYVPRTFFLAPDGTMARDIHAPRPRFLYFFDERNPASLLGGMAEALAKLAK